MKKKAPVVSALLLASLLGAALACTGERRLRATIGARFEARPDCFGEIASASVQPALPEGLSLQRDGTIVGASSRRVGERAFTVEYLLTSGERPRERLLLSVSEAPSGCSFGVPALLFPEGLLVRYPLLCENQPQSVSASPSPPSFVSVNATTGEVSGRALASFAKTTLTLELTNAMGSQTLTVPLSFVSLASLPAGPLLTVSEEGRGRHFDPLNAHRELRDPRAAAVRSSGAGLLPFDCRAAGSCVATQNRRREVYSLLQGVFEVSSPLVHTLTVQCSSACALYLDGEASEVPYAVAYPSPELRLQLNDLSLGAHSIEVLDFSASGPRLSVALAVGPGATTQLALRHFPAPLTSLRYAERALLIASRAFSVSPSALSGAATSSSLESVVVGGWLSVSPSGVLSGTAPSTASETPVSLRLSSGLFSRTASVSLRVAAASDLPSGLRVDAFKVSRVQCSEARSFERPSSSSMTPSFSLVYADVNQVAWGGALAPLTADFAMDYWLELRGFVRVTKAGLHSFKVVARDLFTLEIDGAAVVESSSGCGLKTGKGSASLLVGLHSLRLALKKGHQTAANELRLLWTPPDGRESTLGGALAHLPEAELTYSCQRCRFVRGAAGPTSRPVLLSADAAKYSRFDISPALPPGLSLDPSTGALSGTLSTALNHESDYDVRASGAGVRDLRATLSLRFVSLSAPRAMDYSYLMTSTHRLFLVAPQAAAEDGGVFQASGIDGESATIDPTTGVLEGFMTTTGAVITVFRYNEAGLVSQSLWTDVTACPGGTKLTVSYSTSDRLTNVTVRAGTMPLYFRSRHVSGNLYAFPVCSSASSFVLSFSSLFGGGWMRVTGADGLVHLSGAWTSSAPYSTTLSTASSALALSYDYDRVPTAGAEWVAYASAAGGAGSWVCTRCPSTVSVDAESGTLRGYFASVGETTLTVSASRGGVTASTTLSVRVLDCDAPLQRMLVLSLPGPSPLWLQTSVAFTASNRAAQQLSQGAPVVQVFCVHPRTANVAVRSFGSSSTAGGVGSALVLDYARRVLDSQVLSGSTRSGVMSLSGPPVGVGRWQYSTVFEEGWERAPVDWPSYANGSLPRMKPTDITRYYVVKLDLLNPDKLFFHLFTITFKGGLVAFLNGQEAYRFRVPPKYDAGTLPTNSSRDTMERQIKITPRGFVTGENTLSFEVHYQPLAEEADPFSVSVGLETFDSDVSWPQFGQSFDYGDLKATNPLLANVARLMDHDFNTDFSISVANLPNYTYFSVEALPATHMFIVTSGSCCSRDPVDWDLWGTTDLPGICGPDARTLIKSFRNVSYGCTSGTESSARTGGHVRHEFTLENNRVFNGYQVVVKRVDSRTEYPPCMGHFAAAEWGITNSRPSTCPETDVYPNAFEGTKVVSRCLAGSPRRTVVTCVSGTWKEEPSSDCSFDASIAYTEATIRVYRGVHVSVKPSIRGVFRSLSVGALPTGLLFSSSDGEVFGRVGSGVSKPTSATVTATRWDGTTQRITLVFEFAEARCASVHSFPQVPLGEISRLSCTKNKKGGIAAECVSMHNLLALAEFQTICFPEETVRCAVPARTAISLGESISVGPSCHPGDVVTSATVYPELLAGLFLSMSGMITGTPREEMHDRHFVLVLTVSVMDVGVRTLRYWTTLTVLPRAPHCTYDMTTVVAHNLPVRLSLACDAPVSHVEELYPSPSGAWERDALTGSLTGYTDVSFAAQEYRLLVFTPWWSWFTGVSVTVSGNSSAPGLMRPLGGEISQQNTVVIDQALSDHTLTWSQSTGLKYPNKQSIIAPDDWDNFVSTGAFPYKLAGGGTQDYADSYVVAVNGSICVPVTRTIEMRTLGDDQSVFYIDDMETPLIKASGSFVTKAITLTGGCHAFVAIGVEQEGAFRYRLQWNWNGSFTEIPPCNMGEDTPPPRYLHYASEDYVFFVGNAISITAMLDGVPYSWSHTLSPLPSGVVFSKGCFSGSPTAGLARTRVTVTASHVSGSGSSASFFLTVLDSSSLPPGLVARISRSDPIACGAVPAPAESSLVSHYVESVLDHSPSHAVWPWVPTASFSSFVGEWSGFLLTTSATGAHSVRVEASGPISLTLDGTTQSSSSCGAVHEVSLFVTTTSPLTLVPVRVQYWKHARDTYNGLRLLWTPAGASSESVVPAANLRHTPLSTLYYPLLRGALRAGKALNLPPFASAVSGSYTVSPRLPASLVLQSTSGTISGSLNSGTTLIDPKYTVSRGGKSVDLVLSVDPAEERVAYSAITGYQGELLSAFPVVEQVGSSGALAVSLASPSPGLPIGLSLNASTGEIRGTPAVLADVTLRLRYAFALGASSETDVRLTIVGRGSGWIAEHKLSLELGRVSAGASVALWEKGASSALYTWTGLAGFSDAELRSLLAAAGSYELRFSLNGEDDWLHYETYEDDMLTSVGDINEGTRDATIALEVFEPVRAPALAYAAASLQTGAFASFYPSRLGSGCGGFTASPSLPAGLSLDHRTGRVWGAAEAPGRYSFEVSCTGAAGVGRASVSVRVRDCPEGEMPLTLALEASAASGPDELASLRQSLASASLLSLSGARAGTTRRLSQCVAASSSYTLVAGSVSGAEWPSSSHASASVFGREQASVRKTASSSSSSSSSSGEESVVVYSSVDSSVAWEFSSAPAEPAWRDGFAGWSNWQALASAPLPSGASRTWQYRGVWENIAPLGLLGGLRASLTHDGGAVVWVNGVEVLRRGVPASDPVTQSSASFSIPASVLREGANSVAVEVQLPPGALPRADHFALTAVPIAAARASIRRTVDSDASPTMVSSATPASCSATLPLLFDDLPSSSLTCAATTAATLEWRFPSGRSDSLDGYSLGTPASCANNDPGAWTLSGLYNGAWSELHAGSPALLTTDRSSESSVPLAGERRAFEGYRLSVSSLRAAGGCAGGAPALTLAEFSVSTTRPPLCEASDGFATTVPGGVARAVCTAAGTSGRRTRVCGVSGAWGAVNTSRCLPSATTLAPESPAVAFLDYNTMIDLMQPKGVGANSFTLENCSLVRGLRFDTELGVIEGVPREVTTSVQSCVLVAQVNPSGTTVRGPFLFSVEIGSFCSAVTTPDGYSFPKTQLNGTAEAACQDGKVGEVSRPCLKGATGPEWGPLTHRCRTPGRITISYGVALVSWNARLPIGTPLTLGVNGNDGEAYTLEISPASLGALFNSLTGELSGTPPLPLVETPFTVRLTLKNYNDSATTTLRVTIADLRCSDNPQLPPTAIGSNYTGPCVESSGAVSGTCALSVRPSWSSVKNLCAPTRVEIPPLSSLTAGLPECSAQGAIVEGPVTDYTMTGAPPGVSVDSSGRLCTDSSVPGGSWNVTVNACNRGACNSSLPVQLVVEHRRCEGFDYALPGVGAPVVSVPTTNTGSEWHTACPAGYIGQLRAYCAVSKNPSWSASDVTNGCTPAKPAKACPDEDPWESAPVTTTSYARCFEAKGVMARSCSPAGGWNPPLSAHCRAERPTVDLFPYLLEVLLWPPEDLKAMSDYEYISLTRVLVSRLGVPLSSMLVFDELSARRSGDIPLVVFAACSNASHYESVTAIVGALRTITAGGRVYEVRNALETTTMTSVPPVVGKGSSSVAVGLGVAFGLLLLLLLVVVVFLVMLRRRRRNRVNGGARMKNRTATTPVRHVKDIPSTELALMKRRSDAYLMKNAGKPVVCRIVYRTHHGFTPL